MCVRSETREIISQRQLQNPPTSSGEVRVDKAWLTDFFQTPLFFKKIFLNICLLIWLCGVFLTGRIFNLHCSMLGLLVAACGIQFSDQELNLGPCIGSMKS